MSFLDRLLNFHKQRRWLSHVAYWVIYLLISVSSSKYADGKKGTYGFEFISDALYISTEVIAAYSLAYFIIPKLFYRKKYFLSIVAFVAISYLTSALGRIIIVKICEPLAGVPPKAFETYAEILTDIPKLLYVYFFQIMTAAFIFVFFKIFKDQIEVQKRALELEKEKAETELKLLKTQLNPHFLFNTLNNIYSLSLSSSPATSGSIARLADILDHILYRCNDQYVPLQAEIALVKNYIELEKLRYDERLTVNLKSNFAPDTVIAPLILLSLVENAFKHGASGDAGAPIVGIDLYADEGNIIFKISNTVAETHTTEKLNGTNGIGLSNLRRQLDLVYGKEYLLEVKRTDGYFNVQLIVHRDKNVVRNEKDQVLIG